MKLIFITISIIVILAATAVGQTGAVTIFLAGDSTMAQKQPDKRPETGWGEMLEAHFKDGKVRIENRAMNGRSTKTFISEGRWQKIVDDLKKGDYVFIEFGHNDAAKNRVERYTPPDEYRKNLISMANDVRAKKANPVLMTPVMRRRFDKDGNFQDSHGEYPDIVRAVAKEYKVPLIDMHRKSEAVIKKYGVEDSKKLFLILANGESANYPNGLDDNTHFKPLGAEEMAKLAVEGIKEEKLKLRKYVRPKPPVVIPQR